MGPSQPCSHLRSDQDYMMRQMRISSQPGFQTQLGPSARIRTSTYTHHQTRHQTMNTVYEWVSGVSVPAARKRMVQAKVLTVEPLSSQNPTCVSKAAREGLLSVAKEQVRVPAFNYDLSRHDQTQTLITRYRSHTLKWVCNMHMRSAPDWTLTHHAPSRQQPCK